MRIRDVPDSLHRAFKLACVEENVSMNTRVIQLIERDLREKGKLK